MARTIVTTVARPSGIAATAKAIAVLKQSTQALERSAPNLICSIISKIKTIAQMTKAISPITLPTAESLCCKGVVASSWALSRPAIWPISVCIPTSVTIALPFP